MVKKVLLSILATSMFLGSFSVPQNPTSHEVSTSVEETLNMIAEAGDLANEEIVPNSLIVKYRHSGFVGRKSSPRFNRSLPISSMQEINMPQSNSLKRGLLSFGGSRYYSLSLTPGSNMESAMLLLSKESSVEFVEPNFTRKISTEGSMDIINTNDPLLARQWMNDSISVNAARTFLDQEGMNPGGSRDVVVAVIDTGVDSTHSDLSPNMWVNSGEIPGNGIDDDNNGYIDDVHGVSTLGTTFQHSGDSSDVHGHGTHVAGIVAAKGNNGIGIRGIADNVRIMSIRAGQQSGAFNVLDIVDGINYAIMMKADVINMSYGGYFSSQLEKEALEFAFSEAVLVGAAGNDSYTNRPHVLGKNFYPASYTFVIGVMATAPSRNFAFFTNVDFEPYDTQEYEVMAPGAGIISTIPNNKYASWNGTSMAAPVVSGVAALLRSYFTDRMSYSNRFIMSQIIGTGNEVFIPGAYRDLISMKWENYTEVDAFKALTTNPIPYLTVFSSYVWDKTALNPEKNDGDGIIDAGETIQLGITIRNQWGISSDTIVKINTETFASDNYDVVNILEDTVNYGRIGTFSTKDNGFIYDENEEVIGIENPFTFTVADNAPNDIFLRFNVIITAKNGFDPEDETLYEYERVIVHKIRNGKELPAVITEDMTLTKDTYWIIPASTMIVTGVTVTVEAGTQIQFWGGDPEDLYALKPIAYLQVEGSFIVNGTEDEPVVMMPSDQNLAHSVNIYRRGEGYVEITHAKITNPIIDANLIDYVHFNQAYSFMLYRVVDTSNPFFTNDIIRDYHTNPEIKSDFITNSIFKGLGGRFSPAFVSGRIYNNLFDSNFLKLRVGDFTTVNNVFLNNYRFYQSDFNDPFQGIQTSFMEFSSSFTNVQPTLNSLVYNPETGTSYFVLEAFAWQNHAASQFAESLGGHIVDINSNEENEFIKESYPGLELVIGLEIEDTILNWTSGESIGYIDPNTTFIDPFSYKIIGKSPTLYQSFVVKDGLWDVSSNLMDKRTFLIEVPGEIYASDIQLLSTTLFLAIGENPYDLNIELTPSLFDIRNLTVVIEDESIVEVTENNQLIPLKEGRTKISIYSKDQLLVRTFIAQVSTPTLVDSISLSSSSSNLTIGTQLNINVNFDPVDTTQRSISWSSSNPNVVSVDATGRILALSVGKTVIEARIQNSSVKASLEFEVVLPVASVKVEKESYVVDMTLEPQQIQVSFFPGNSSNKSLKWESSNKDVAYVNEQGQLVSVSLGTAYIRATAIGSASGVDVFDEFFVSVVKSENLGLKAIYAGTAWTVDYRNHSGFYLSLAILSDYSLWIWGGDKLPAPVKTRYSGFKQFGQSLQENSMIFLSNTSQAYLVNSVDIYLSVTEPDLRDFSQATIFDLVENFTNIKEVAQSGRSYYLLLNNGSLYSFGDNTYGQLGDGTKIFRETPVRVFGINNVVKINVSPDLVFNAPTIRVLTSAKELYGFGNNVTTIPVLYATNVDELMDQYSYRQGNIIYIKRFNDEPSQIHYRLNHEVTSVTTHGRYLQDIYYSDVEGNFYRQGILVNKIRDVVWSASTHVRYYESTSTMMAITKEGKLYFWMDNRYGEHANFTRNFSNKPVEVLIGLEANPTDLLLQSTSVANNQTGVGIREEIRLNYNYKVIRGDNFSIIHFRDSNNEVFDAEVILRLNVLIVRPQSALNRGERYRLMIPEKAIVDNFNSPNASVEILFTTSPQIELSNEINRENPEPQDFSYVEPNVEATQNFYWTLPALDTKLSEFVQNGGELGIASNFAYNAILNNLKNPSTEYWLRFVAPVGNRTFALGYNYWGTNSVNLITRQIIDFNNYQGLSDVLHAPFLSTPKESTYPFVYEYYFSNELEAKTDVIGLESSTLHLVFNRDMDVNIQPDVFFGPAEPFTDYRITGEWISPREWIATPRITLLTGDGNQYLRVANAIVDGTKRLSNGDDKGRMMFRLITLSSESMSLQATGAEGRIILDWLQDDVSEELLAGYNIYRSKNLSTNFSRVNQYVVTENTYEDFSVEPGTTYYYKFTVVRTDFIESTFSNIASGSSFDTIAPTLSHTPITQAFSGQDLTFIAFASDNIGLKEVIVHIKNNENSDFNSYVMTNVPSTDRFTYVLKSNLITNAFIYYYISASDDLTTVRNGSEFSPHNVTVIDSPTINTIAPNSGSVKGGTNIIINGNNFKDGAEVFFGSFEGLNVVVESSSTIRVTTPIGFPSPVNVKVVNPFGGEAILVNGYTFIADTALVSIPFVSANLGQEIFVPIRLSNVSSFISGDFELAYDGDILSYLGFTKGGLALTFPVFVNKTEDGVLLISIAGSLSVSGTGDLVFLRFRVTSSLFDTSSIIINEAELNGGNLDVVTNNGVVSYEPVITFSGTVYYYFDDKVVENVMVMVEGEFDVVVATTSADGTYTVSSLSKGDYVVSFRKSDTDDAITAFDAALILQRNVGLITFTDGQNIVADVDNNGRINALDASYILQYSAGFVTLPFNGRNSVWTFTQNGVEFSDVFNDKSLDVTAYLIGDVSGNYGTTASLASVFDGAFRVGSILKDESLLYVPVDLVINQENIFALSFRLTFDPSLRVKEVKFHESLENAFKVANTNVAGQVTVAIAGVDALASMDGLIEVVFETTSISDSYMFTIVSAMINESKKIINVMNGYTTLTTTDFNNDGVVNELDLLALVDFINATYLDSNISPFDFNNDGIVDLFDMMAMIRAQRTAA